MSVPRKAVMVMVALTLAASSAACSAARPVTTTTSGVGRDQPTPPAYGSGGPVAAAKGGPVIPGHPRPTAPPAGDADDQCPPPGAPGTERPPADFDPLTATPQQLARYGFPARPSGNADSPAVQAWQNAMSHVDVKTYDTDIACIVGGSPKGGPVVPGHPRPTARPSASSSSSR